jgi:hypothetical protein
VLLKACVIWLDMQTRDASQMLEWLLDLYGLFWSQSKKLGGMHKWELYQVISVLTCPLPTNVLHKALESSSSE